MNPTFLHGDNCDNTKFDIARMQKILSEDPNSLERVCVNEGCTPLQDAAKRGHERCVQFFIDSGAIASTEWKGSDLMTIAIEGYGNSEEIVQCLLNLGYNPNFNCQKDKVVGSTYYLKRAVTERSPKIMKLLLDYGAQVDDFQNFNIELHDYFYYTPTSRAIDYNSAKCLKLLLLHGAAVDDRQLNIPNLSAEVKDCLSLIHHFAVASCYKFKVQKEILNILHQFGANLWQKNRLGLNPLEVRLNNEIWLSERRERDIDEDFDEYIDHEVFGQINEYLRELMSKPLSLCSLSRIAIVRAMGPEYFRSLHKLPTLPRQLKAFLRTSDLPTSE